jgi:hypothetical protein
MPKIITRAEAKKRGFKWCWVHATFEPIANFGKSKGRPGGLQPLCREARRQQATVQP